MKTAFIGYQVQEKYNNNTVRDEDQELFEFLTENGINLTREIWDDSNVNWEEYGAVILKSPWDYHEKLSSFLSWLRDLESKGIKVLNPANIIKWNSDKHYLADIAQAELPVITTVYMEKGSKVTEDYFTDLRAEKLVIKPCVSAGAKNTLLLTREEFSGKMEEIDTWLKDEAYMVQPFVEEILEGEWSFLFFGGQYSHSLLKTPKQNDFRVQHYLGGSISYPEASEEHISQAREYVEKFAQNTLYARVDGVIINGVFHLMELELIEPYLFLKENHFPNYLKAVNTLL